MLFDHHARIEMIRTYVDRLQQDWGRGSFPARHTLGTWLIRLGQRLAPERRPSGLAHEALPRC
jgi:hypothetical protein